MQWFIITHIFSTLVEFVGISRLSEREKDLEILILRHQLDILERKQKTPIKPNQVEKMMLAVLTGKLKQITNWSTNQPRNTLRIFQPATVLKWHRELVRRKWTTEHKNKGGRPKIDQEMKELIVRLANENPRWGYGKIEGELLKLGLKVSQTTIRGILKRNGIVPSPVRNGSIGWRHLMKHYKQRADSGLRFLYSRNTLAQNAIRLFLHRIGDKVSSSGWYYHQPRFSLGDPTS